LSPWVSHIFSSYLSPSVSLQIQDVLEFTAEAQFNKMPNVKAQIPNECQMTKSKVQMERNETFCHLDFGIDLTFGF